MSRFSESIHSRDPARSAAEDHSQPLSPARPVPALLLSLRVSVGEVDLILAPIGVVVPNSMMGEITPSIAEAVTGAPGRKLLLPINQPHFEIVGIEWKALTKQISAAIEIIRQALEG
jgi:hypothetical protein